MELTDITWAASTNQMCLPLSVTSCKWLSHLVGAVLLQMALADTCLPLSKVQSESSISNFELISSYVQSKWEKDQSYLLHLNSCHSKSERPWNLTMHYFDKERFKLSGIFCLNYLDIQCIWSACPGQVQLYTTLNYLPCSLVAWFPFCSHKLSGKKSKPKIISKRCCHLPHGYHVYTCTVHAKDASDHVNISASNHDNMVNVIMIIIILLPELFWSVFTLFLSFLNMSVH